MPILGKFVLLFSLFVFTLNGYGAKKRSFNPVCGNHIVEGNEECDDGNNDDNDGCSHDCKIEPVCGNGNKEEGEECDDGNNDVDDGCSSDCTLEDDLPEDLRATSWNLTAIRCGALLYESTKITDYDLYVGNYASTVTFRYITGTRTWGSGDCVNTVSTHDFYGSELGFKVVLTQDEGSCEGTDCSSLFGGYCSAEGGSQTFQYNTNARGNLAVYIAGAYSDGYSPYDNPCGTGQNTDDIVFYYAPSKKSPVKANPKIKQSSSKSLSSVDKDFRLWLKNKKKKI